MCAQLIRFVVQQKVSQHFKSIILQYKLKNNNNKIHSIYRLKKWYTKLHLAQSPKRKDSLILFDILSPDFRKTK